MSHADVMAGWVKERCEVWSGCGLLLWVSCGVNGIRGKSFIISCHAVSCYAYICRFHLVLSSRTQITSPCGVKVVSTCQHKVYQNFRFKLVEDDFTIVSEYNNGTSIATFFNTPLADWKIEVSGSELWDLESNLLNCTCSEFHFKT